MTLVVLLAIVVADPLSGTWQLNTARSHYGSGAEPRQSETFTCAFVSERLTCTINAIRGDGRATSGKFVAAYDGRAYPVTGIEGVDSVKLSRAGDSIADATFSWKGSPVFGYRAVRSSDRKTLTIVSVDPVSRRMLTSVIIYDALHLRSHAAAPKRSPPD